MTNPPKSKIYTRVGDKGETTLVSGIKVRKDHPRAAAYGSVDELNSSLGVSNLFIKDQKIRKTLQNIQNELFNIGAELADPRRVKKMKLEKSSIEELERFIDQHDAKLSPLHTFILPAGEKSTTFLQLARAVCRRAEREVVSLARKEKINPNIIAYLNRLSDLLFVLARYLNKGSGKKEILWKKV
ncbi:MAG: ATP:cob(I)alamin adenosyltransferase [Candidatus Woykebacteria bacterium GWB1_45_5]|uniref:Corrinoid adenosyltransferase n=2 Tax=Candidatus Woykeibacteriota TaxID=1817899 RepID=A0A1G1W064_9BACT|nr:MAG: ATP:cob(I)alamin adenosyltransferase [Candidatus Woykebacteria bacterium GWA1_44_8]OGY22723.1 MAG: ATP:cob(I)alamin adenosyltransferase [Candidatus Woykebacteria bacterium GWB1_45_5]